MQTKAVSGGLGAWTIDVTYDPKTVEVTSCKGESGSICNASFAPGVVRVTGASASGLSGPQTLAAISFAGLGHGNDEAALKAQAVTLTDADGRAAQPGVTP